MSTTVITVTAGQKSDSRSDIAFALQIQTDDSTGAFPPDGYIVSVAFTGDNGDYHLTGASATISLETVGGNHYKTWEWPEALLPFSDNPFTDGDDYEVTILTITIPSLVHEPSATAQANIIADGFVVGSIGFAYSESEPVGQVISQLPLANTPSQLGAAISLIVSLGPAPAIYKLTQKLLLNLHRVFDKDPHPQLALRLQYDGSAMTWAIANGVLTTTVTGGTGTSQIVDLKGLSVAALASYLESLPGYSVPYQDTSDYAQLDSLVLLDATGNINTSNGDHLYGYTTLLWAYLEAVGSELGLVKAQIPNALAQMAIPTAEGEWLDEHGSYYLVPRSPGQPDTSYVIQIPAQVLQPRGNNVAIAMAIQTLAPAATRVRVVDSILNTGFFFTYNALLHFDGLAFFDGGGGESLRGFFDVDFSYDFELDPISQSDYLALIESNVEIFRDGGTQLKTVIFRNLNSTTDIISDKFVGRVRVIVIDDFTGLDFRLLENGQIRLLESGDARLLE